MGRKQKRPGGQARGDKSNHCLASINPTGPELKRGVAGPRKLRTSIAITNTSTPRSIKAALSSSRPAWAIKQLILGGLIK